ncbi:MAG: DUF2877 domain-containing protein [Hungatella sp.]|nr:DUF2877 domain-containing protein [Hungatella sp.]
MDHAIFLCDQRFCQMVESLRQRREKVWVHSVFERAVNLEAGEHLYTLLAAEIETLLPEDKEYLGVPGSAYADIKSFRAIKPASGEAVFWREHGIQIGETCFFFSESGVFFLDAFFQIKGLPKGNCAGIGKGLIRFEAFLPEIAKDKGGGAGLFYMDYFGKGNGGMDGFCLQKDFLQAGLEKRLARVCDLIKGKGSDKELKKAVADTVGAGIGLTPSADDFFCGMLIGMNCMGRKDVKSRKEAVEAGIRETVKQNRTTRVSGEMLSFHVRQLFPRIYIKLAESFMTGGENMEQVMERISRVGHSSGVDMACGMAAAFRIFNVF